MHNIAVWWTTHPNWVSFILFVLASAISLYASETRRLLSLPFAFADKAIKDGRDTQLAICKRVHGNAFELILFLARTASMTLLGLIILSAIAYFANHKLFHSNIPFVAVFLGGGAGALLRMVETLSAIAKYRPIHESELKPAQGEVVNH